LAFEVPVRELDVPVSVLDELDRLRVNALHVSGYAEEDVLSWSRTASADPSCQPCLAVVG